MNVGVNLFGLKGKLYRDFEGTLTRLKEMGMDQAEVCISFNSSLEPPKELKITLDPQVVRESGAAIWNPQEAGEKIAQVRRAGLQVNSTQLMVMGDGKNPAYLEGLIPQLISFAQANGLKYYVISLMSDRAEMKRFLPVLDRMSRALSGEGITLAYHNHEMECMVEEGGSALEDALESCPQMALELDVGWAKYAGADILALMEKYKDRLVLLHLKDVTADAGPHNRATCFTPIGEGSIPLKEILNQARACALDPLGIYIDQDDAQGDMLEELALGLEHVRNNME